MTVKLLHFTVRKRGGFSDLVDIAGVTKGAQLYVFDVCAVFMFLLKSEEFTCKLLQNKLGEKKGELYSFITKLKGYYQIRTKC